MLITFAASVESPKSILLHLAPLEPDPVRPEMRSAARLALLLILALSPVLGGLMAQGGPPVGGPPPCWPPPCIPIDGGVSLLAAAGALLGGRLALKARRARKVTA